VSSFSALTLLVGSFDP